MDLIGMLHSRKSPVEVPKAYACAVIAKMEEVNFCYFTYKCIDIKRMKIKGWIYEQGQWIRKELPWPKVVINISSPKTIEQKKVHKLLKFNSVFTSYPVGNKLTVYKKIQKAQLFAAYTIPTYEILDPESVLSLLDQHDKVVLKPQSGNQGKNIYFIWRETTDIHVVIEGANRFEYTKAELYQVLTDIIPTRNYLLQPFIESKTKTGLTYDLRVHVQKNGTGEWVINLIYPRISAYKKLVSNISSGGFRGDFDSFLIDEFGEEHSTIKNKIERFALEFTNHFEALYPYSFDELGIDIALDKDGRIWIFEVNWRPGSKHREFEEAKLLIPYCKYLLENKKSW